MLSLPLSSLLLAQMVTLRLGGGDIIRAWKSNIYGMKHGDIHLIIKGRYPMKGNCISGKIYSNPSGIAMRNFGWACEQAGMPR